VSPIRYSNLLLIVINQMTGSSEAMELVTKSKEVNPWWTYNQSHPCYKNYMNNLPRRRLDECFVSPKLLHAFFRANERWAGGEKHFNSPVVSCADTNSFQRCTLFHLILSLSLSLAVPFTD
jgi:hypothetical protein